MILFQGWVSVTRIVNFFKNEDLDDSNVKLDNDLGWLLDSNKAFLVSSVPKHANYFYSY